MLIIVNYINCFEYVVSFDFQVEAGDVILKVNDIDVVKFSIKEGNYNQIMDSISISEKFCTQKCYMKIRMNIAFQTLQQACEHNFCFLISSKSVAWTIKISSFSEMYITKEIYEWIEKQRWFRNINYLSSIPLSFLYINPYSKMPLCSNKQYNVLVH